MKSRAAFAYAPAPAEDELLGSWVHRLALGHGVNGSLFLGVPDADIDWSAPPPVLARLAAGSGRSTQVLRAMTLANQRPGASRSDFARALGSQFPGCHAFCPICAQADQTRHGETILRMRDAGVWRLACVEHHCLLDSIEDERQITPAERPSERSWRSGRIGSGRPAIRAPAFALAFERALARAGTGRALGPAWRVREPDAFLRIARELVNLVLVQRRPGRVAPSAALLLLGEKDLSKPAYGAPSYDPDLMARLPVWPRIRGLMAAALLLLNASGAHRLGVTAWASSRGIWGPSDVAVSPWPVAAGAWALTTLQMAEKLADDWPIALRAMAQAEVRRRLILIGQ